MPSVSVRIKTETFCCNTRNQQRYLLEIINACSLNNTLNPVAIVIQLQKPPSIQLKKAITHTLEQYKNESHTIHYQIIQVCLHYSNANNIILSKYTYNT